jgi:hypothetical protein
MGVDAVAFVISSDFDPAALLQLQDRFGGSYHIRTNDRRGLNNTNLLQPVEADLNAVVQRTGLRLQASYHRA